MNDTRLGEVDKRFWGKAPTGPRLARLAQVPAHLRTYIALASFDGAGAWVKVSIRRICERAGYEGTKRYGRQQIVEALDYLEKCGDLEAERHAGRCGRYRVRLSEPVRETPTGEVDEAPAPTCKGNPHSTCKGSPHTKRRQKKTSTLTTSSAHAGEGQALTVSARVLRDLDTRLADMDGDHLTNVVKELNLQADAAGLEAAQVLRGVVARIAEAYPIVRDGRRRTEAGKPLANPLGLVLRLHRDCCSCCAGGNVSVWQWVLDEGMLMAAGPVTRGTAYDEHGEQDEQGEHDERVVALRMQKGGGTC